MSITDELREYATVRWEPWAEARDRLLKMCDHIDAEHDKACNDAWDNGYEADYLGIEKWLTEHPQVMEHHGWMRLPKDADYMPIRVGDVMELPDCSTAVVVGIGNDTFFYIEDGEDAAEWSSASDRIHHHAPTVEDVLREFMTKADDIGDYEVSEDALITEYAAKLRLAGDE